MSSPETSSVPADPAAFAGELKRMAETASAWPFEEARKIDADNRSLQRALEKTGA